MKKFFIICVIFFIFSPMANAIQDELMNIDWWNKFNDEYLVQNLLTLYEKNYDLKNAELKIKENEQIVKMQFANELPVAVLDGNLSRDLRAPRQQFGDMKIPTYSQYNYNIPITAAYEIDIWGKNRLKTKSKKEQLEIIKQSERATCIALSSEFAVEYFNLIKTDKLIEIQENIIKIQSEILNKTTEKYKCGLCPITDIWEQEKILSTLKEEYNYYLQTKEVLKNVLRVYLTQGEQEIQRNNYENISLIDNIPTEYSTEIIENRPDYKQEEANLRRIGFDVRVAKREFLPTFTIFGQIGLNAYHLNSLFNSPSQFFNAGILPTWDIFSGGRKKAFFKIKKYQYEQAVNDFQKAFLVGVKDVNTGLSDYKTSLKNYNECKKRLSLESKIYNLANDKKQIGASSDLDILFAKEKYLLTEKEEVSNKINSIIATIGLYKAAGGVDLYKLNNSVNL